MWKLKYFITEIIRRKVIGRGIKNYTNFEIIEGIIEWVKEFKLKY